MSQYAMCPQCDEPFTRNSNELGICDRCHENTEALVPYSGVALLIRAQNEGGDS